MGVENKIEGVEQGQIAPSGCMSFSSSSVLFCSVLGGSRRISSREKKERGHKIK